jgi:hypothetical protein
MGKAVLAHEFGKHTKITTLIYPPKVLGKRCYKFEVDNYACSIFKNPSY